MKYLIDTNAGYAEIGEAWKRYVAYLQSVRDRMPPEVFEFASAKWHYDPNDHRSLHDSWVEACMVREVTGPAGVRDRGITIELQLLGAYHDGQTLLRYQGVVSYQLSMSGQDSGKRLRGHGDWMVDEVTLSESGKVLHEIVFSSGARWVIECDTIVHSTTAPANTINVTMNR